MVLFVMYLLLKSVACGIAVPDFCVFHFYNIALYLILIFKSTNFLCSALYWLRSFVFFICPLSCIRKN